MKQTRREVTKEMTGGIEKQLMQDVEAIRTFNWIKGTDEEVEAMRKKLKTWNKYILCLMNYSDKIKVSVLYLNYFCRILSRIVV